MPALPILAFIAFLVLKLTHTVDWSWWWITAPLWGAVAIYLIVILPLQLLIFNKVRKAHRDFFN